MLTLEWLAGSASCEGLRPLVVFQIGQEGMQQPIAEYQRMLCPSSVGLLVQCAYQRRGYAVEPKHDGDIFAKIHGTCHFVVGS
jgi:hypothetical protein